jgi:hypothetical protein
MRDVSLGLARFAVRTRRGAIAALLFSLLSPRQIAAQGRLSEKGVVAQTVGTTTITVEYYRPVARGRAGIFPNVVHWGERWTPGANWATTIDVDHDLKVEGKLLPKGRYSIWTTVRPDSWTVDFHRGVRRFHLSRPDSTDRQLSVSARVDSGAHTEVLTFDFPEIATGATTLRLRWGTMVVPLHLTMIAPPLALVAKADRVRFIGRYDVELFGLEPGQPTRHRLIEIAEVSDTLRWRDVETPGQAQREFIFSPAPGSDDELTRAQRAPDGQWWTQTGLVVAFTMASGRATGFEVRVEDGTRVSRGTRVP